MAQEYLSGKYPQIRLLIGNVHTHDRAAGYLKLENARLRWFLSINHDLLPKTAKAEGKTTYLSITVEGEEIEFSDGFGLEEVRQSIEIVPDIRKSEVKGLVGEFHPLAKEGLSEHPFEKYS